MLVRLELHDVTPVDPIGFADSTPYPAGSGRLTSAHEDLLEPAGLVAGEPDRVTGLRRLYVCLTRAVTSLVVLHAQDLPEELS